MRRSIAGLPAYAPQLLDPPRFIGAAASVLEPDASATDERNAWNHQELGTKRKRTQPGVEAIAPAEGDSDASAPGNAANPTLFRYGKGDFWEEKKNSNQDRSEDSPPPVPKNTTSRRLSVGRLPHSEHRKSFSYTTFK